MNTYLVYSKVIIDGVQSHLTETRVYASSKEAAAAKMGPEYVITGIRQVN